MVGTAAMVTAAIAMVGMPMVVMVVAFAVGMNFAKVGVITG
jgi:hypothetical protein